MTREHNNEKVIEKRFAYQIISKISLFNVKFDDFLKKKKKLSTYY